MTGAQMIVAERKRQQESEGYDSYHDDCWEDGELLEAGILYAELSHCGKKRYVPQSWPWLKKYWKPSKDPIRNLVKAGALIAAEIDRLQRRNAAK